MATGSPKARWNGNVSSIPFPLSTENISGINLVYGGKRPENEVLRIESASTRLLWESPREQEQEHISNRLYYGDNLPILASLLRDPTIKGKVRLIYIDPPFATNSIFQSRSQGDAYADLLVGAHYIEFLRARLVLLRELLATDGSIYVHLDDNMAFHMKIIMDEILAVRISAVG